MISGFNRDFFFKKISFGLSFQRKNSEKEYLDGIS